MKHLYYRKIGFELWISVMKLQYCRNALYYGSFQSMGKLFLANINFNVGKTQTLLICSNIFHANIESLVKCMVKKKGPISSYN